MRLNNPLNGQHGHWAAQSRARKLQRQAVWAAWIEAGMPRQLEPGQTVRLTRIGPRQLDSDNLQAACKAVRDQVAEMLGIDDRLEVWTYDQQRGEYGVRIEIV